VYCRERRSVSGVTPAMDRFGCFEKMEILQEGLKRSSQGQEKRKSRKALAQKTLRDFSLKKGSEK